MYDVYYIMERRTTFYITKAFSPTWDELSQWCQENGIDRSAFVREAIEAAYKRNQHKRRQKFDLDFEDIPDASNSTET